MKRLLLLTSTILLVFVILLPTLSLSACGKESAAGLLKKNTGCYVDGSYLRGVKERSTTEDVLKLFDGSGITIVKNDAFVGTGSKVKYGNSELTVIVKGDVNGDGEVDSIDYLLMKRAIIGSATLEEAYLLAASIQGEEELSSLDYLLVKRHCIGSYNLYEDTTMNFKGLKIAYIPLDDRPVNVDRVRYLAQSVGFELLMPDPDYYATKLDGRGFNSNGTQFGNREELVKWLKSVDAECDYFVISLDQMLSGGLVSSRAMHNTDLSYEYGIIDYLAELSKNNYVYFFDTVMRLASTVDYQGYQSDEYTATRNYGLVGRKLLSGADLTIEKIIAGYRYGENGAEIPVNLTSEQLNTYLEARERKLRLADYFLAKLNGDYQYCYYGVDDSNPTNTIQTNEINYIQSKLVNGRLFAGCDELGLMCVTRLTSDVYANKLKIAVSYFGGGENSPADNYDIGTLKENIEHHIISIDAEITTSAGDADVSVLVLTKPVKTSLTAACDTLIEKLKDNISKQIPTIVIDASTQEEKRTLQNLFVSKNIPLTTLVGYSNWNTVGNSIGIALSQGVTRVVYLKNCSEITRDSNIGFLKSMTFAYIKDIGYQLEGGKEYSKWIDLINNSPIIVSLKPYKTQKIGTVSVSNYSQPWKRSFEITFDISVK